MARPPTPRPGDRPPVSTDQLFGRSFRSLPIPAAITRLRDGLIIDVNDAWCRLFGFERAEALGKTFVGLGILDAAARQTLADAGKTAGFIDVPDVVMFAKPQRPKHVALSVKMEDVEGETYAVFTLSDHTPLAEAHEALERAHSELKATEASRLRLLSSVAHDLMNPLMPMKIHLYLLEKAAGSVGEEFAKPLLWITRNMEQMVLLVQDLRQFAKMQSGQFQLRKQPVDLSKLVVDVVESVDVIFHDREIRFQHHGTPPIPLQGDPDRIGRVIYNLLGNAAKFTPRGGDVALRVGLQGDHAIVSVKDSGPGMDPAQVSRLFQPFTQVHEPTATPDPGMGLGLFICKQIVELHGGKIWAESPGKGQGSTFAFSLPTR